MCHLLRLFKCLVIKNSIDIAYDSWIDFLSSIYIMYWHIICIKYMKREPFERKRLGKERENEHTGERGRKWVFIDVCNSNTLVRKLVCYFGKYLSTNQLMRIHLLLIFSLNLTFCSFKFLFQFLGCFSIWFLFHIRSIRTLKMQFCSFFLSLS